MSEEIDTGKAIILLSDSLKETMYLLNELYAKSEHLLDEPKPIISIADYYVCKCEDSNMIYNQYVFVQHHINKKLDELVQRMPEQ